ncbi:MAG: CRISPR-associated protein [Bacteroidaceae bacterium]|nr:CRISPR-associated protein [Bacteroidaceae bacterium]
MATYTKTQYTHRFLARFVIEAKTPIAVGMGEKGFFTDSLVATDVNGLPYIPATSIAGVVRSMVDKEKTLSVFGKQSSKSEECRGSEIIFTEAKILDSTGMPVDGLNLEHASADPLLREYKALPIRQHVRITDKGVAKRMGKFDEQIVYAGTRFCFEMEMVSDGSNLEQFKDILGQFNIGTFRLGSGTRKGFGEIEVVEQYYKVLDLTVEADLQLYLSKSSNIAKPWHAWEVYQAETTVDASQWVEYKLKLVPEDFFLFSSGFGDGEVDITPVKTRKVVWQQHQGALSEELTLIPASSLKGAIAHRAAYHWNKLNAVFADDLHSAEEREQRVGNHNEAVRALFGYEDNQSRIQKRGNLLFSDVIVDAALKDKILNHVTIDRFTGGTIDGHLFSEKVSCGNKMSFEFSIWVKQDAFEKPMVQEALECTMKDICKGLLPLGGGVNRGNGVFTGQCMRNGELL